MATTVQSLIAMVDDLEAMVGDLSDSNSAGEHTPDQMYRNIVKNYALAASATVFSDPSTEKRDLGDLSDSFDRLDSRLHDLFDAFWPPQGWKQFHDDWTNLENGYKNGVVSQMGRPIA